jgi:O-succinylbenzoate synthase
MKPIFTAVGTIQDRQVLELRLEHSSGAYGLGEASPLPGFSVDDYEECKEQLHELTAEIAGLEPNDLWQGVVLSGQSLNLNPAAQHAVEEALWNLSASLSGIKPEEMLTSEFTEVPLHRLVDDVDSAKDASLAGYNHFKVKVGHEDVAESMNRIRRISKVLPQDAQIRLDANGQWTAETLNTLGNDLLSMKVWCIEEPVSGLEQLAELRRTSPLKILADESVRSAEDLDACIRLNAAHGVVLKPMLIGGPLSAYALAQKAIEAGLSVSITTTFDGPIARASASRIAGSLGSSQLLSCGLQTGRFFNPPQAEIASIEDGAMSLEPRP